MFKNKRLWTLLALATIVALLVTACRPAATPTPAPPTPTPPPPPEKLKAAFVYVAPIGDLGWTWAHEQGRLMVEKELGVETVYIENVPEGPDAERVIRDFAQKGYDVIFATSFGFMDPMLTVAQEFPDKYFEHCSGYKTADNMATYFGRMYQPRFLSGLVAGKATKANKIGYVAAFPIPEVLRGINAFTLGVRTANPEAAVHVVWTNTWFDPVLEKEAAVALLDEGCDVIAQHQDTTEPQKAAQEQGAVSIGYDSDMRQFVGDTVLTSPVWNWGPYCVTRVKAAMDGTWKTGQYWGGMKEGIVDLAPLSPQVPGDVKALVEEYKQKILSGKWDVFTGPIKGQGDVLSIPEGVTMTDEEMLSMDWFVDGVVGEAPGQPPEIAGPVIPVEKKVAFVYVGPVGDLGWTYAHDQGRLYLEKELGVETTYSELVAEGPDANRVIRDYAEKGYDVIFATSFGYMDDVIEIAAQYPDTIFEHCTGYKTAENAGIYDGRGYQGWYLAGIAAGKVTKTNVLGYIAPYPIPEVVRNMNAFTLGAQSVNPEVEVHPVWIFTWVDPVKEREAAQALLDLGCDVIARESDSTEPDKLAEENGIYAIGYNAYVPDVAPNALLTAPIWNWGVFYKKAVQAVMNDAWTSAPVWWGLAEGLLDLAPFGPAVPDDAKALIEQKKQGIIAGTFDVFVGPIKDNTGELRVPDGVTMPDEEKLAFDWLVEGVVGTIPK
ncbi:MAG: BMP family ABC transporter substrate-binding protein [Anaerolineae bacterium]|nr:BMP family ABC transporter substrate-binding protein [Anaerolineae bacterium]